MADVAALAANLTLKFDDAEALADALRTYSGAHGSGGLCIQVVKYYELGDLVQLHLEYGEQPQRLHAVVAWRKPGFIGVRFDPRSAAESKTFVLLKRLMGETPRAGHSAPPVDGTKPFAE